MNSLWGHFDSLGAIGSIVLGFSFLIFVHELGHHLVAKAVGIKVTQFAIGFGPCVLAWRKGLGLRWGSTEPAYEKQLSEQPEQAEALGETEYRLNWVPLGGYVKMHGQEDLNPEAASCQDARSFSAKPIWARACVISAGVVMNLIFGAIFFIIAFMAGVEFPPAIAGMIIPNSPAATTFAAGHDDDETYRGLKTGDNITHIDGKPINDFADLAVSVALAGRDQTLRLTVQRHDEPSQLVFPVKPRTDTRTEILSLGVKQPISLVVADWDPAEKLPKPLVDAQVRSGMRVSHVAGKPVDRYDQFELAVSQRQGLPVDVTFVDPDLQQTRLVELSAVPALSASPDGHHLHVLGMVPAIKIAGVEPKSPSAKAGLEAGDMIVRIGPTAWPTWSQVVDTVEQSNGRPIQVAIQRDGVHAQLNPITPNTQGRIGIYHGLALDDTVIVHTLPDSPMSKLDLNPGSKILSINDQRVNSFADIQRLFAMAATAATSQPGFDKTTGSFTVDVSYQPNIANTSATSDTVSVNAAWASQIAAAQWSQPLSLAVFKMLTKRLTATNPVAAATLGIKKTHQAMLQTYVTLLRLFQGTVPVSQMRGPLGIADAGTSFAKQGWPYLLFFLGLISINLVVINFLPIPIVDGGLLVFLIIEKIKGSPVSVRVQTAAMIVGMAMIGSVLLFTFFYDAKRLFGI